MIDQGHTHIRQLAQQLGLKLDNLHRAERERHGAAVLLRRRRRTPTRKRRTTSTASIRSSTATSRRRATRRCSTPTPSAASSSTTCRSSDWIEESVPGGITSEAGPASDVAYNIEYGAESSDQSSLNLLYLLGYSGQGQFRIFGPSNEKYHVRGGNDQIPSQMAAAIAGQIELAHELVSIKLASDGGKLLTDVPYRLRHEDRRRRPRRARPALLDPSAVGQLREGGIRAAQGDGDRGARHGNELQAAAPVRPALLERASAATARRSPTPVTSPRGT